MYHILHSSTGHVIWRMLNDDLQKTGTLELNISKMVRNGGSVTKEYQ